MKWETLTVLITGGTGSFGHKFVEVMLKKYKPQKLIVFSRDELKQHKMRLKFNSPSLRYFVGNIRDKERVYRAMDGVDVVIHAAALKQIPSCEYNPFEAVKTNILGAQNIIDAAIDKGVKKVIALSSDKAVNPINLYGATKLAMEKLFIAGNAYVGGKPTCFSAVRYGNVVGSRGSVVPFFLNLVREAKKEFPITDEKMTRFWITLDQSVDLVLTALRESVGGEVFVPRIPSMRIIDVAKGLCPNCKIKIVGIRPGEKLHETLISEDEGRKTKCLNSNLYVVLPQFTWTSKLLDKYKKLSSVPEGFIYRSDTNDRWLSARELKTTIKDLEVE